MALYLYCNGDVSMPEVDMLKREIQEKMNEPGMRLVCCRTRCILPTHLENFPTVYEHLIRLCREYKLLPNERTTVLSSSDSLLAVQLCLTLRGKKKELIPHEDIQQTKDLFQRYKMREGEGTPALDDDKQALYDSYQQFLLQTNQVDFGDVFSMIRKEMLATGEEESELMKDLRKITILCFGNPTNDFEKSLLKLLCLEGVNQVKITQPCSADKETGCTILSREITWLDSLNSEITESQQTPPSTAQVYLGKVFVSYIELLLNTRSELSLATIFNVPDRELGHQAFTALKHTSQQKALPMYQTAVSHIIKIRLGGKAYAPSVDCELAPFVKGLGELISFIQKLQTIIEEVDDIRTACKRVITNIKSCIKKCKTCHFKQEDVEDKATYFHDRLSAILDERDKENLVSPDRPASDGGSLLGRRTMRVLRQLLDSEVASKGSNSDCFLEDFSLSPTTPTRVQCVLSKFQSPEVCVDESLDNQISRGSRLGLQDRQKQKQNYDFIPAPKHIETTKEEKLLKENLNSVIVLPSKTLVYAAPGNNGLQLGMKPTNKRSEACLDKENVMVEQPQKRQKKTNDVIELLKQNEVAKTKKTSSKSLDTKKDKTQKSCRRKLLPVSKGQQNITAFFRI